MSRATHVLQWPVQRAATWRQDANLQSRSQFGSESATRLREAGFASNRASAMAREYVPGPCTHRPSSHGSWGYLKSVTVRSGLGSVSYTHLRAHETVLDLVCR